MVCFGLSFHTIWNSCLWSSLWGRYKMCYKCW